MSWAEDTVSRMTAFDNKNLAARLELRVSAFASQHCLRGLCSRAGFLLEQGCVATVPIRTMNEITSTQLFVYAYLSRNLPRDYRAVSATLFESLLNGTHMRQNGVWSYPEALETEFDMGSYYFSRGLPILPLHGPVGGGTLLGTRTATREHHGELCGDPEHRYCRWSFCSWTVSLT